MTITSLLIAFVALIAFALVAIPLLFPSQSDPLPDDRDPVRQDLEEERDALFRAIRELDARQDMAEDRRAALRARYEAKAAKVLRAIDERSARTAGWARRPAPKRKRRFPVTAVTLLTLLVLTAAALPGALLPRIGEQGTTTTTDVDAARQLKALQDAARTDPSVDNLLALGDAYFSLQEPEQAEAQYQKVLDTADPVPADVYKRMAYIYLQSDLDKAYGYLQQAEAIEPDDPDTLFALGEVSFAKGDLADAKTAFTAFLATPGNANDEQVTKRIALIDDVQPLMEAVEDDPSESNLLALGDAFWQHGEKDLAVSAYFQVLTGPDPASVRALSRTGQLLYQRGRDDDAIGVLERAASAAGSVAALEPSALLTLGNAYYATARYQDAVDALTAYLGAASAGADGGGARDGQAGTEKAGEDAADTARALIASATARMQGLPDPPGTPAVAIAGLGQSVFASSCATCHGPGGEGGAGPTLVGNRRAADAANVLDVVRFGRGMMPGFSASLSQPQIDAVVTFVTTDLAARER